MKDHLDELVSRAMEKHSMPLRELIETEHLQDYELGYEDILYADEINIAKIPHGEYMILVRQRWDEDIHDTVVEYAIYWQEDHDGHPLYDSLNMNATYHLVSVRGKFTNMVTAIAEAANDVYTLNEQAEAIVRDITDGDPLADLTEADAVHLIAEAVSLGYDVPACLKPDLFLRIYESLKGDE